MPKKGYWISKANKERRSPSDADRIIRVMSYIGRGYNAAQHQKLVLSRGRYGQRFPDILLNICGFTVPFELDGLVHGHNDEISESNQTKIRNDDYIRDGYFPIILNHEELKVHGISEEIFTKCAIILFEPIYRSMNRVALERIK